MLVGNSHRRGNSRDGEATLGTCDPLGEGQKAADGTLALRLEDGRLTGRQGEAERTRQVPEKQSDAG